MWNTNGCRICMNPTWFFNVFFCENSWKKSCVYVPLQDRIKNMTILKNLMPFLKSGWILSGNSCRKSWSSANPWAYRPHLLPWRFCLKIKELFNYQDNYLIKYLHIIKIAMSSRLTKIDTAKNPAVIWFPRAEKAPALRSGFK